MESLYAVCAPGLEPFTRQEILQLGFDHQLTGQAAQPDSLPRPLASREGGVFFEGDLKSIYQSNLELRTASRILLRFGEFYSAAFSELEKKSSRLPWERFVSPGQPVSLRVSCHKSRLYHSDAVARTLIKGIGIRIGRLPTMVKYNENDLAESPQLVIVRLVHDLCTISIDSSGANLHRRGYRLATAKAPLRETLAAGLVMASGWDGASPLIDPFCGSGTIPIEAALTANKISPGMNRRFAFMDWPDFDSSLWGSILSESQTHVRDCELHISGSDRDAGAIKISQSNAMRAGVSNCIEFSHRAVSAIEPVGIGWVVTNPPYGVRTRSNKDLRDLYAQFGNTLRLKCPGWHIAVLCADFQLLGNIGLKLDTGLTLVNGGIPVRVARGTVEW